MPSSLKKVHHGSIWTKERWVGVVDFWTSSNFICSFIAHTVEQ